MGVVYRAQHEHLARTVALKLLTPELAASEGFRGRFMRESRLAASLDHPSVVTVYDAGEVDGTLYIAMRFVAGTDLAGLLRSAGSLPPDRALALLGQVASALDAAHALGLVHRDVKPANVLIEGTRAYLTDFGLTKPVKAATDITATGQFLGTVAYVAPEQIQGHDVDGRADVYALGCVLYECLTGRRPFVRDSEVAVMFAHMKEMPTPPSQVKTELPAGIDDVVMRALAKSPDDRYATCMALIDAARGALLQPDASAESLVTAPMPRDTPAATPTAPLAPSGGGAQPPPATAPAPVPQQPSPPPRRRARTVVVSAVAALAVGGAAAAGGALSGGDDKSADSSQTSSSSSSDDSAIAVGDKPAGVTVTAGHLWVANSGDDTVTRVAPDGSDRRDIGVGDAPIGISSNADEVWVASSGSNTVTRIDAQSGAVKGKLDTEKSPWGVVVNSRRAFLTNRGSGTVSEWYVPSGVPRRDPVRAGADPHGVVVVPPGNWTANTGDDTVVRLEHGIRTGRVRVGK